jgi:hypothetical protein
MAWPIAPRRPFTAEKAGEALSPYAARRCKPRRQAPLKLARLLRRQFHTRGAWSQHDGRKARSSSNGPWVPDGGLARRHIFRIAAQELRRILEVGAMVTWAKEWAPASLTVSRLARRRLSSAHALVLDIHGRQACPNGQRSVWRLKSGRSLGRRPRFRASHAWGVASVARHLCTDLVRSGPAPTLSARRAGWQSPARCIGSAGSAVRPNLPLSQPIPLLMNILHACGEAQPWRHDRIFWGLRHSSR